MINGDKWLYHQKQKSAQNERFAINDDKSFYHWYANLLSDTELTEYGAENFIVGDLAGNSADMVD